MGFGENGLAEFVAARKFNKCDDMINQLVEHMQKWRGNTLFRGRFHGCSGKAHVKAAALIVALLWHPTSADF